MVLSLFYKEDKTMNEEEITAFRKLYTEIKKVAQTVIWKLHEAYPIERYKYLAFDSVDEHITAKALIFETYHISTFLEVYS